MIVLLVSFMVCMLTTGLFSQVQELPDLTGTIDRAPEMAAAGEDLGYLYVTVKNIGKVVKKKKESYCVFLVLSKDKEVPVARPPRDGSFSEDMAIGAGMCNSRKLKPGKVWKIENSGEDAEGTQMIIHKDTPPGNYFLVLVVDADNQIHESNEKNNVYYFPITIM